MTTTENICASSICDRPAADGYVCWGCVATLKQILDEMPWLVDELNLVLARQTRYGSRNGSASTVAPIPMNPRASQILIDLHATLATWCLALAEERPEWTLPDDSTVALARWLSRRLETIRCYEGGGELVEDVARLRAAGLYAVDRPVERRFAGPCECGEYLYAKPGAHEVRCGVCGNTYPVEEMVAWMQEHARSRIVTEHEAYVLLGRLDLAIASGTIRKWVERKRILPVGASAILHRFRMADLIPLAAEVHARKAG